jgi:hypothetical protein
VKLQPDYTVFAAKIISNWVSLIRALRGTNPENPIDIRSGSTGTSRLA